MQNNILIIICDQLSAQALQSYGNHYNSGGAMNQLAAEGTLFEQAYCNAPLCQPSRASFWTSRYTFETQVDTNLRQLSFPHIADTISTLGEVFQAGGYQTMHFGKEHDYGSLRGFTLVENKERVIPREDPAINLAYETFLDIDTTTKVTDWLASPQAKDQPFLAVADLQNPHNICNYIGENQNGSKPFLDDSQLPPLPDNFDTPDMANRPEYIQYLCCAHRRLMHAAHWSRLDYRRYLYAYHDYINRVEKQVAQILDTLAAARLEENTLVVFLADHGEGMAAHGLVTKYGNFYEESLRVPLIFRGPGIPVGRRISGPVSLLDLKPTLQSYAGLAATAEDRGHNLLPVLLDESVDQAGQPYVVASWIDEFSGYTVPGRMYRFGQYKYMAYRDFIHRDSDEVSIHEELYDLAKDPGEQCTLILDEAYSAVLEQARNGLAAYCTSTGDPFYSSLPDYDRSLYRLHKPGFSNHEGPCAVDVHILNRPKNYAARNF